MVKFIPEVLTDKRLAVLCTTSEQAIELTTFARNNGCTWISKNPYKATDKLYDNDNIMFYIAKGTWDFYHNARENDIVIPYEKAVLNKVKWLNH